MEYTFSMDNIKHIKTIYDKNDTLMTLLSSLVVFVLPVIVFSFCYYAQNDTCSYSIKSEKLLMDDLKVVSIQSSKTINLSMIGY